MYKPFYNNYIKFVRQSFLFFLFFQISFVFVLGQDSRTPKKQLVGTWQCQNTTLKIKDNNQLIFDGKGHFIHGSESSYSGDAGSYANSSSANPENSGTYSVSGNSINLSAGDGSTYQLKITVVQNSGEVTEITYNQTTFAKALCD